jgi:hypothetical protein
MEELRAAHARVVHSSRAGSVELMTNSGGAQYAPALPQQLRTTYPSQSGNFGGQRGGGGGGFAQRQNQQRGAGRGRNMGKCISDVCSLTRVRLQDQCRTAVSGCRLSKFHLANAVNSREVGSKCHLCPMMQPVMC